MQGKRAPRKNNTEFRRIYPVHVIRMTEDSIEIVKKIEIECGLSKWTFEDYKEELNRIESVALISKTNSSITGFLVARLIMHSESQLDFINEAEIYNIGVKAEFRKEGIAQALLNRFIYRAKIHKVSKIWLEVRESNYPAINFYQKNNFFIIGSRRNFYHSPVEDALAMSLNLTHVK